MRKTKDTPGDEKRVMRNTVPQKHMSAGPGHGQPAFPSSPIRVQGARIGSVRGKGELTSVGFMHDFRSP